MASKERLTVRVNLTTLEVFPMEGYRIPANRLGWVTEYVVNEGARAPRKRNGQPGGKFTSRRLTVRLPGDDRKWIGQFKNGEKETVILRPLDHDLRARTSVNDE